MNPPNPPTEFESASVLQRFIAQAIDCAVIVGLAMAPVSSGELFSNLNGATWLPAGALSVLRAIPLFLGLPLAIAYRFIADGVFGGAALGKRVMRIHVVDAASRRPCSIGQAAIRTGVLIIPLVYLIEPIVLICDGQLRWGDHVARTWVLRRVAKTQPAPTTTPRALNLAGLSETLQKLKSPKENG